MELCDLADSILAQHARFLERIGPGQDWARVRGMLTTRIADDLRAGANLVLRGYYPQGMALGASIYELCYTAGYIGRDDERAGEWLRWDTVERTPWSRNAMVRYVRETYLDRQDHSAADARYRRLCWGKHGNPILQRQAGIAATPEAHVLNVDPALGGKARRWGELVIWTIFDSIITYVAVIVRLREVDGSVGRRVEELVDRWVKFNDRMVGGLPGSGGAASVPQ